MTLAIDQLADEMLDACRGLIRGAVAEQVEAIKLTIADQIKSAVSVAMESIPKPQDGKDADPEAVERLVSEQVEKRLEGIGPGVSLDQVMEVVKGVSDPIAGHVSQLKNGRDGKDADPEVTARMVQLEVARAMSQITPPADGKDGAPGKDGVDGLNGKDGINGVDGKDGAPGLIGKDGSPGKDGKDGSHGRDAFDLAVIDGFVGSKKDWLLSLRGKDGSDGVNGKDGSNGLDGAAGLSAYAIAKSSGFEGSEVEWLKSLRGKDGSNGLIGEKGLDGREGRDGIDGRPGRDGANVADPAALLAGILPSVDLKSSYRQGTLAKHAGGLIVADRQTDGDGTLAGWSTWVRGLAGVECERGADERSLVLRTIGTDGVGTEFDLAIPAMIYRDVFEMDGDYQEGDIVTYNGSAWHCNKETKGRVPGTSKDWTLMVKKGRDNK